MMLPWISSLTSSGVERLLIHLRMPLYRNGYALVVNSGATSAFGLLYWMLAARYYPPETIGLNAALVAAVMFLANIAQLNLTNALNRFIPIAGRLAGRFIILAYVICAVAGLLASTIFIIGVNFWSPELAFLKANPIFFLWFCAATAGWCLLVMQDSALTGLRQSTWVPIENLAFVLLRIALLISLASVLTQFAVFASWTIPLLLMIPLTNLLIFWRLIPIHRRTSGDNSIRLVPSQVVRFVSADYCASLVGMATANLWPILILMWAGPLANAYFFLPWTITYALYLVSLNMGMALIAEASNDESKLTEYTLRAFVQTARLLVPIVILTVLGAPYILGLIGSVYAEEGSGLLRLMGLSAIPHMISSLYMSYARVLRQMLKVFLIITALSALSLVLSYILLGQYGLIGIGAAWLISETVVAAGVLLTLARQRRLFSVRGAAPTQSGADHEARFSIGDDRPGDESFQKPSR
jgi:O-antigen/teichoic acid export membrane protein